MTKAEIRRKLRAERLAHAQALPMQVRALVFHRPPRPALEMVPEGASVGLYHAVEGEAPAGGYARFFAEHGYPIALPWFADRDAPMSFRVHSDPFDEDDLVDGPFGLQPNEDAAEIVPQVPEDDPENFAEFTKMEPAQEHQMMQDFVDRKVKERNLAEDLVNALSKPKAATGFKFLIDGSKYKDEWVSYRNGKYHDWVKEQVDSFNYAED